MTGCTLVEPAVGAMAAFADEDSYKFERLLTLLRTAEDKQLLSMIGEIDLSDGTAITFTYLDRFTVKMPWMRTLPTSSGMCARWWSSLKPIRPARST